MYDKEQALKLMADRGQVLQDSVGQFKDGFGGLVKINGEIRFLAVDLGLTIAEPSGIIQADSLAHAEAEGARQISSRALVVQVFIEPKTQVCIR